MSVNLNNLPSKTQLSLEKLSKADFIKNFYLAGGTAVALFLNHRRSDDLDFFSEKEFQTPVLIKRLKGLGSFKGFKSAENTLIGELNGIKVSFFTFPYKLLETPLKYNKLKIARFLDLAAMKILAISDRGAKRDFIDLYFLCQQVKSLDELLYFFQKKFGKYDYNIYHIIKSLTYFNEAETEEMPNMYIKISWRTVKNFFKEEKTKLAKKFLKI
jgi:predicted nucleotidyltransferase component of viral defense system